MQNAAESPVALASARRATISSASIGSAGDHSTLVALRNANGMEVRFIGRGGIILSVIAPDRDGVLADVVLGFEDLSDYIDDRFYLGAIIGRNANRIANAAFTLDGQQFLLTRNDGPHHLHGGVRGFSGMEWNVNVSVRDHEASAELSVVSPDGDEGYPGTVNVTVTYTLTDSNDFIVRYCATTTAATPIDLTQHSYFNLSGGADADVLDHELIVYASAFTPVNATLIPTGELSAVRGTPFDFQSPRRIGDVIRTPDEQLRFGGGYDHNFVLDGTRIDAGSGHSLLRHAARLCHERSGRTLDVFTSEPAMQLYTGNELDEVAVGKRGPYARHAGVALETQHYPNTPNQPSFPTTTIRPDDVYTSETVYRFSVDQRPR